MAFDQKTRNLLQRTVTACRRALDREFTTQLQELYGIQPDGSLTPIAALDHLGDEQLDVARLLRERINHLEGGSDAESLTRTAAKPEHIARVIREQAFTVLNRLAALRLCEERGLVLECVRQGVNSEGFQLFMSSAGNALGETHAAYNVYLHCLFDELAIDLGVLFDRFSPLALLFPQPDALAEVLSELNGTGKAAEREQLPPEQFAKIWQADETIGWIYQYYNDETERKKMREESAAPRNSRELAVRNQFFTPRYVVEFLTDNTQGRIWYEMSGGRTDLREKCRYLVRRPSEVFLAGTAEVYRELFSRSDSADDMTPVSWVTEAFVGQLLNLTENASDPDTRWVGAAIRPADFENLTGEPCKPFEEHRLSRLSSDIIEGRDTADTQNLVWVWASLSDFIRCDGSRGYGAPHWEKLWAHFRKLAQQPVAENLSQADLLKQPVFIPHRPLKDPRTILMLDPACGSMHFGLYAFDLFEVIYREAWEFEEQFGADILIRPLGMKSLRETFATKEEFLRQVPRLIIEHNIHGIDIDPRAAQIAGLALWLRAQNAWKVMDLKPAERPRITRSNIVCAEPMPGEKELLREFVEKEFPAVERGVFLQLLETIFDKMQLAGEAGSLLKIEEEIHSAIADAKQLWKETPKAKQTNLFPEAGQLDQKEIKLDVSGITDDQFWGRVEERIYTALRDYSEQAETGGGFQRRLFAEDAARGFAFIDVCRKRYDVALMNPPFGEFSIATREYGDFAYSSSCREYYAAFIDRARLVVAAGSFVGAISSRTGFFITSLFKWRKEIVIPMRVSVFAELGEGVLDAATVETAAYVLGPTGGAIHGHLFPTPFIRLPEAERKDSRLCQEIASLNSGRTEVSFVVDASAFRNVPDAPFAYWLPHELLNAFERLLVIEGNAATIKVGLQTGDDFRFVRTSWEVPAVGLASDSRVWVAHAKGGENAPFWTDIHLVVKWLSDGQEVKSTASCRLNSPGFFFKRGLTFPYRVFRFSPAVLPDECITGVAGMGVFALSVSVEALLSALNTDVFNKFVSIWLGRIEMGSLYQAGTIQNAPFPQVVPDSQKQLGRLGIEQAQMRMFRDTKFESTRYFLKPPIEGNSLEEAAKKWDLVLTDIASKSLSLFKDAGVLVKSLYGLQHMQGDFFEYYHKQEAEFPTTLRSFVTSKESIAAEALSYVLGCAFGRWDIRYATGEQAAPELPDPFAPLPVCAPGQLQNAQGLPARPEDAPATYPITIQWDGIIADDPTHPVDIERCVREVIEEIWKDRANAIEQEACEILGVNSLRDYFRRPAGFFADHLKRYSKSRRQAPIYWPLATASGSYTLWIYYHRLDDQTLYKCIQQFIDPKLADVEKELTHLRAVLTANEGGAKERKRLEELEALRRELIELRTELELWAPKWKPNLNDGVLITAAPLWKLFRLPKWQKDLKACWQELEKGDYDWSHLAFTLWPDRVREKCKSDRSLAIAHGLEDSCDVKAPEKKVKKAKKTKAVELNLEEIE